MLCEVNIEDRRERWALSRYIQNMLLVSPSLWRGHLSLRVDPGPMFQHKIREAIETLEAFGYGISEPDDRNVLIRDAQTISRLYPTEYATVLGAIPTEATVVEDVDDLPLGAVGWGGNLDPR